MKMKDMFQKYQRHVDSRLTLFALISSLSCIVWKQVKRPLCLPNLSLLIDLVFRVLFTSLGRFPPIGVTLTALSWFSRDRTVYGSTRSVRWLDDKTCLVWSCDFIRDCFLMVPCTVCQLPCVHILSVRPACAVLTFLILI